MRKILIITICMLPLLAAQASAKKTVIAASVPELSDTVRFVAKTPLRADTVRFRNARLAHTDTLSFRPEMNPGRSADNLFDVMPLKKVTYRNDWFVFANGGVHTFIGDHSGIASFGGTISPEFGGGFGYWFTPYIGVKAEFIRSVSRGYSRYVLGDFGFGYGPMLEDKNGEYYRKMKTEWWDVSCSVTLNLTRFATGYEGYRSRKNMNQFLLNVGIGCVHHLNYKQVQGTGYDWSGHAELQYSRFFGRTKRLSLDLILRWLFYSTNFDYESKRRDRLIDRMDSNLGLHLGVSYYLGKLNGKKKIDKILTETSYDFVETVPSASSAGGREKIDIGILNSFVSFPEADGIKVESVFTFAGDEEKALFSELMKDGTVTQVDVEVPAGDDAAEARADEMIGWLRQQERFGSAIYQKLHMQPGSYDAAERGDSLKVRLHYMLRRQP